MSELINARNDRRDFRWQLLTTVSAIALLSAVSGSDASGAADQDAARPTVWIELGGQLDHVGGQGNPFTPGFLAANPNSPVLQATTPLQAQNPPPFSFGEEGKISFQPEGSNWTFSAAVNYGRSSNFKHVDHQTNKIHYFKYKSGAPSAYNGKPQPLLTEDFADTQVHRRESHAILDFSVGKDVGLGLFGRNASSVLGFGVRFAQFSSGATFDVRARPDIQVKYVTNAVPNKTFALLHFHNYHATGQASRSFHGIGPSLSWNGMAPVAGNPQNGELTFDWGGNAALLFGKQKASVQHQESAQYQSSLAQLHVPSARLTVVYQHPPTGHSTDRSIIVPNVGGFAGASYRIENFKVSFGYRADFFFGAVDGGIDTRKSETLGFYGPFATVSVGFP